MSKSMIFEALLIVRLLVQWETGGPPQPSVTAMAVPTVGPPAVYAACGGGGDQPTVYRSTDGAATWDAAADGPPAEVFIDLQGDPRVPDRLFASTLHAGFPNFVSRLYRSVDGAATWTLRQTIVGSRLCSIAVDAIRLDTIYASCDGGVFLQSDDAGESFAHLHPPFTAAALRTASDGTLFAITPSTLLASHDGGQTWSIVTLAPMSCPSITALAIDPTDPSRMFLGTGLPRVACGEVLRSTDAGATWSATAAVPGPVADLAIDPSDPSRLYVATSPGDTTPAFSHVLVSEDEGLAWRDLELPDGLEVSQLRVSTDGRHLYAATFAGVQALALRRTVRVAPRR